MKKLILIITLSFLLLGCGNSNTVGTTKITKYFQDVMGNYPVFNGEINTEYLKMVETEFKSIKIIDTNETYQAYSLELNQSFEIWNRVYKVDEEYRQYFKPQHSQLIDFEKNRLLLYGISGFAGNGFKEDIYLLSEAEAKLIITKKPYNGLQPQLGFFTIFAYIIDREIKTLHLSETLKIDLNDTAYY